ncbi:MAG: outer membrane beta-barrel protein [Desulfobacterales bacterium]
MKLKTLVVSMAALIFLSITHAAAFDYVGLKAGYTNIEDSDLEVNGFTFDSDFEDGWIVGVALGFHMQNIRLEGEVESRQSDIQVTGFDDEDLGTRSVMANGYYDFLLFSGITPYIGAGIGLAYHDTDFDDDTVFAYQGTVGLAMAVSPTIDLDFAYRWFASEEPELGGVEFDYESHNFTAGIRINFQ